MLEEMMKIIEYFHVPVSVLLAVHAMLCYLLVINTTVNQHVMKLVAGVLYILMILTGMVMNCLRLETTCCTSPKT